MFAYSHIQFLCAELPKLEEIILHLRDPPELPGSVSCALTLGLQFAPTRLTYLSLYLHVSPISESPAPTYSARLTSMQTSLLPSPRNEHTENLSSLNSQSQLTVPL